MTLKNRYIAVISAVGMLVLILDSKTALGGAVDGISLSIRVLIPSLFPFFVLSTLLTSSLSGQDVKCLQPIATLCKIPKGGESLIAVGLLGGYPVGAQNVSLLFQQGQLNHLQAARLLAVCNNAGPAFIFGVLGNMFPDIRAVWLLWLVHILSVLLTGSLLPRVKEGRPVQLKPKIVRLTGALNHAVKAQALVCGWVVFMRILLAFIEEWFLHYLPLPVQIVISGVLELSNGCIRLSEIEPAGLRFVIASGLLSHGGVCVTLQTASVAERIPMRLYFPGKILQCCISILLSCMLQFTFPRQSQCHCAIAMVICIITITAGILFFKYSENSSGIPDYFGV